MGSISPKTPLDQRIELRSMSHADESENEVKVIPSTEARLPIFCPLQSGGYRSREMKRNTF